MAGQHEPFTPFGGDQRPEVVGDPGHAVRRVPDGWVTLVAHSSGPGGAYPCLAISSRPYFIGTTTDKPELLKNISVPFEPCRIRKVTHTPITPPSEMRYTGPPLLPGFTVTSAK